MQNRPWLLQSHAARDWSAVMLMWHSKQRGYDSLADIDFNRHFRVNRSSGFACGERPMNGIESFWGDAKKRLIKLNGIDKKMLYLHIKETEYRFNHRHGHLCLSLLKLLRQKNLFSFLSLIENIRPLAEGSFLTISGFNISLRIKAYCRLNFDWRKRSVKLKKTLPLA